MWPDLELIGLYPLRFSGLYFTGKGLFHFSIEEDSATFLPVNDTAQPVHLTNTRKMLHRNFNGIVGVFKAAINMQKEFKL